MSIAGFRQLSHRLILITSLALVLSTVHPSQPVAAQASWPPFWFDLIPAYGDGRITYQVALYSRADAQLRDLAIKIPLPPGTRFVEANALPEMTAAFDGQELTFFTPALDKYIEGISFTLEVIDPAQRVITAQAWIAWKGTPAGDYLSDPVSIDLTRQPLNWTAPGRSRLQLRATAELAEDSLTLELYPRAVDRERMWDVSINLPLPRGTSFISADAPAPFVAGFDGREVSFFTLELERQAEVGPLTIQLATQGVTDPTLLLPIHAAWKNGAADPLPGAPTEPGKWQHGPEEGLPAAPAEEQIYLEWSLAQPHLAQRAVFDAAGDVPFSQYDLTGIAFQELGPMLMVNFETAGEMGQVGAPVEFSLFVDADCDSTTGEQHVFRGAEYQVRYNHESGKAVFVAWDPAAADWDWSQGVVLDSLLDSRRVVASIPRSLLGEAGVFCWVARAASRTAAFYPDPPEDWLPDEPHLQLTWYRMGTLAAPLAGVLAVALPDEANEYTVHVFSLPSGDEMTTIPNARQPDFHPGGQRLLLNQSTGVGQVVETHSAYGKTAVYVFKTSGLAQGIYEYHLAGERETQVSQGAAAFPTYNPQGTRVVYVSLAPTDGEAGAQLGPLVVQCSLLPPSAETRPACQDLAGSRVLVDVEQGGEIQGNYPVWTGNDTIAYQACQGDACGIYAVGAWATEGAGMGGSPMRLTRHAADIPADAQGNLITFMSSREGDWEVYVMNLQGADLRNVSNSRASQDGLPVLSPDGNWVAFVSDRDGGWAVWAAPVTRGPAHKLFDLPVEVPWGPDVLAWTGERLSWGP